MPYRWTRPAARHREGADKGSEPAVERLVLWPHRSLSLRGFVAIILADFLLLLVPALFLLGTVVFWFVLAFSLLALAGLWLALRASFRAGGLSEELILDDTRICLRRREPDGRELLWEANPYWVEVRLHESEGPVPAYVTLRGQGREVEIGAFLSEDERRALYRDLAARLPRR